MPGYKIGMTRTLTLCMVLAACGGTSWNTTVADHPDVRAAMLGSVIPGQTTEKGFTRRWGNPTQKIREGAQVSYVYRNMSNPPGYRFPQYGSSTDYVVVTFQYGLAIGAVSNEVEGCRATFAPRPPGSGFFNPTTVKPVNCGLPPDWAGKEQSLFDLARNGQPGEEDAPEADRPGVPADVYEGAGKYK